MKGKELSRRAFYVFLLIGFFVISGCGGNSSKKISFFHSDLEGYWKTIGFGQDNYGSYYGSSGYLIVNTSGEITEGNVNNFGIDVENFTGGTLAITNEGTITGIIDTFLADSDTYEKQIIPDGQMTLKKNVIVHPCNFTLARRGVGILLKKGESFTISDLEGAWVFPFDGIFSFSVNSAGAITKCNFLNVNMNSGTCSGNLSITSEGNVAGGIEAINGKIFKMNFDGQMSSSKDSMILAGGLSTSFEGMSAFAIKRNGTFSSSDGKGKWRIIRTSKMDALFGTVSIDTSGTITEGKWTNIRGESGIFTGGELSISETGSISGVLNVSSGKFFTILGGQISIDRDIVGGLDRDEAGYSGIVILVKTPE
ncbi:MAG: hypothetical protein FJ242_00810 [Nitrospira sp.]|nr:hypothetical protein [Nitrospira sp.]